jgi:hypothetical protein
VAWYLNHYHCTDCDTSWDDEWSCCCDDECPNCGSRNWSPVSSDDLTEIVVPMGQEFAVMRSPDSATDKPRYVPIAQFTSEHFAYRFVEDGELT